MPGTEKEITVKLAQHSTAAAVSYQLRSAVSLQLVPPLFVLPADLQRVLVGLLLGNLGIAAGLPRILCQPVSLLEERA